MGEPFIPRLTKPSGKDSVFLTLSGQRSSNPIDEYATVPNSAAAHRTIFRRRFARHTTTQQRDFPSPTTKSPVESHPPLTLSSMATAPHSHLSSLSQIFPAQFRTTTCFQPPNQIPPRPAFVSCAVSVPTPGNSAHSVLEAAVVVVVDEAEVEGAGNRRARTPSKHQPQLQLVRLRLRQRQHLSSTRRQEQHKFKLAYCGLHTWLQKAHQHSQPQLESQHQPSNESFTNGKTLQLSSASTASPARTHSIQARSTMACRILS